jgi:DNA-binding transcriptional regulator YdaS (Cro superfamily)
MDAHPTKLLVGAGLQNSCCIIYNVSVETAFMSKSALHQALRRAVAKADNNQSKFAAAIGTSQQLVSYWLSKERPLPAEFVLPAESAGFGSRHDLRPDLYPREESAAA